MKTFRLIAVSVVFAAIFAVSALAQTTAGKIGLINTQAFDDDKAGITKYVAALNSLETEFKPTFTDLQTLGTKIQALQKEIQDLQAKANSNVPIDQKTVSAKLEEYDKLTREYKFKEEDAKARYQRREAAVMGPIRLDIGNAIQEYTKKNGYLLILDPSKDQTGLILGLDEAADVTKQFIVFYNARPATTATVTK
ncbi:MAG TPA: OmpH family outer membrane protein [Pyrinomonadaceae bacterium]|jgi:Skp family chaperone for outer membrane proteins|nr:OmpH family outer membrane protein [Pyrinomonadaceae bacterium]